MTDMVFKDVSRNHLVPIKQDSRLLPASSSTDVPKSLLISFAPFSSRVIFQIPCLRHWGLWTTES